MTEPARPTLSRHPVPRDEVPRDEVPRDEVLPGAGNLESADAGRRRVLQPIRDVLGIRAYRYYWMSQFGGQLVGGTLRFAFIWLVLDLSDWAAAAGVIAFASGLPALLLSLPAGAWSDRTDRRVLVVAGTLASAGVLALVALGLVAGAMSLGVALVMAGLAGVAGALVLPAVQAMVPDLVPPERLQNAIALQTIGMQAALFVGALLGGAAIELFGLAGAFGLLALIQVASALAMLPVRLPARPPRLDRTSLLRDVREGLRFAWKTEPLRSLLVLAVGMTVSFGVIQINLPGFAKAVLGRDAFASSALIAMFAPGMLVSSVFLASRATTGRQGLLLAIAVTAGLGGGQVLLGSVQSYSIALVIMTVWGLFGGVAITVHRALLQASTPAPLMGRIMGLATLAMVGSYPLSALLSALLVPRLGPAGTIVLTGAATMIVAPFLVFRRSIRSA